MKTLVIRLAGTVDDDSLPKFGELKINCLMNMGSAANYPQRNFKLVVKEPITATVDGTGFFTNNDYTGNLGKKITVSGTQTVTLGISSSAYNLKFSNKYAITSMEFWGGYIRNVKLTDLRDMVQLTHLFIDGATNVSGTLSDLATLVNLKDLRIDSTPNVTGPISSLLPLTQMTYLRLWASTNPSVSMTGITGDTADIATLYPTLESANFTGTAVTGSWPPA